MPLNWRHPLLMTLTQRQALAAVVEENSLTLNALQAALEQEAGNWEQRALSEVFKSADKRSWDRVIEYASRAQAYRGVVGVLAREAGRQPDE